MKYLYAKGDSTNRIFNPEAFFDPRPYICICEGEMDAITATQAGLPAVAIPGVARWDSYLVRCFDGYDAVYVLADNDDAGQGEEFAETLCREIPNARQVMMPEGHDVNSFYCEAGGPALYERLGISE